VSSLSERTPNRCAISRLVACVLVLVIVVLPLVACLPSKITPPPVNETTPPPANETTPPPVNETTPPPVTVKVELSGKIDTAGILLEDIEVISDDGRAVLRLAKRMRVVDAQGQAPDFITVTARPHDPSLVNLEEVNGYNPRFGCFEEADLTWTWLDVIADWDSHRLTAAITCTGVFVASFEIWPTYLIS